MAIAEALGVPGARVRAGPDDPPAPADHGRHAAEFFGTGRLPHKGRVATRPPFVVGCG